MEQIIKKLIMSLVLCLLTYTGTFAYDFEVNGIYYNVVSLSDLTVAVTSGNKKYSGEITIPAEVVYNGKTLKVIEITQEAFQGCKQLTSVIIPNSVTSIVNYAFSECSSLSSIIIGESVTSIGEYCFAKCSSMESITIPNSVTSIGGYCFAECSSLVSITIPNSVTTIGEACFLECSSLLSIDIPQSVTSIGEYCFQNCSSLVSIVIPNSVTSMDDYCLSLCSSLESVTIPNSVTSIGNYCFWGCSSLISIDIPDSVTYIGNGCFNECSSLVSITIPNSVTYIGYGVLAECRSLESINLSNYLDYILYGSFENCRKLSSLEVPGSVFAICQCVEILNQSFVFFINHTFDGCNSLNELRLLYSENELYVGYNYFSGGNLYFDVSSWEDWTERIKYLFIDRNLNCDIPVPNLEKLEIGENIHTIDVESIPSLEKLSSIVCHATIPPELPEMSNKQYLNVTVSVPYDALAAYQADPVWGKFWNLQSMSVDSVNDSIEKTIIGRYDLSGKSVDENYKGMVIVRFSDGSIKKLFQ